eukprot:gene12835-27063_t
MGSAPSFCKETFVEVSEDKKSPHRNSGKCQFHSVDRFLQLALQQLPLEDALKAIVDNPIAFTTFTDFLSMNIICGKFNSEFISIMNNHPSSLSFEDVSNIFRNSLQNAFASHIFPVDEQSMNSRLFSLSCHMFPAYLQSQFFENWRRRETSGTSNFSGKNAPPECTLPELQTVYSISEKSYSVSGKAQVINPSVNIIPILSIEKSTKIATVNNPNIPIGILLHENENNSLSSGSTLYSSIHDNPILHREKILSNCDPIELSNLIKSDKCGWITALITACETLPIGITLSSISPKRPGYPVIYLNKHFGDHCGHKREDVLGEKFGFMQRPESQIFSHSQHDVMNASMALEIGRQIVSRIDISRNNKIYTTLVTTKHIFDTFKNGKFVIGLHMEVQSKVEVDKYAVLLQQLMDLIPSSTC